MTKQYNAGQRVLVQASDLQAILKLVSLAISLTLDIRRQITPAFDQLERDLEICEDTIQLVWGIEDVHNIANIENEDARNDSDENELTDDQARSVLSAVDNKHDATIGVNWDVISSHIGDL